MQSRLSNAEKFCSGMKLGDGKFGPCMKEHKEELSEGCRTFMMEMKEQRKEKKEEKRENKS